jgi:hypothetical protein
MNLYIYIYIYIYILYELLNFLGGKKFVSKKKNFNGTPKMDHLAPPLILKRIFWVFGSGLIQSDPLLCQTHPYVRAYRVSFHLHLKPFTTPWLP